MIFVLLKYNVYLLYDLELNAQPYNFDSFFSLSIENLYYRFEKILIYLGFYTFNKSNFFDWCNTNNLIKFL
jgi:hypothetical protein